MPIESTESGVVITGEAIDFARLLAMRSALRLEISGLRRSGRPISAVLRREFGWKGNKQKILEQLNQLIDQRQAEGQHQR